MALLHHPVSIKVVIISLFVVTIVYQHLRGRERMKFRRHLFNHSAPLAPINALMYLFSAVPSQPYLPLCDFPEMEVFQEHLDEIRAEGMALLEAGTIAQKERHDDIGFNSFLKRGWSRFYLNWYGYQHPSALAHCPVTCELVRKVPNVKAAMFAYLPAGGVLNAHRDPYAGSLRYHLGLVTPNSDECAIVVDGQTYSWRDGEAVMFDETYVHHAYNRTDKPRLIFFCDVERPLHTRFMRGLNRFFGRYIMGAAKSPNIEGDATGGINKFYRYVHSVKNVLGKLKKKNPTVFRWTKYALIAGLIVMLVVY